MIDISQAHEIAKNELKCIEQETISRLNLELIHEKTINFKYGWIIYFRNTTKPLIKGLPSMAIGGGPLLVDCYNETVYRMPFPKHGIQHYIDNYTFQRDQGLEINFFSK